MEGLLVGQGLEQQYAGEAAGNVPEHGFMRLAMLGAAVGAQIRLVHGRIMAAENATCMALRVNQR